MDRRELADFLRSRRARVTPADAGLPTGPRRRTPGLRREEVAQLAFLSAEYYTRLEQARGPRPSYEVLAGLVRALRLSDAERDHLHHLAGAPPGPAAGPPREVRQSILDLLRRLTHAAAIVLSATYEVLAWNDLAAAFLGDFSALPRAERNLVRRAFLAPPPPPRHRLLQDPSEAEAFAHAAARHLRAAAARYPDDPEVAALVDDLLAGSAQFARLWAAHDVRTEPTLRKSLHHSLIGSVAVTCDILDITDRDQQLVIYTAEPGSPAEEALRLLAETGAQRMDVPG